MDFGWVLGGFWEAKILDFRTFFFIFSMQSLKCNLEGQKIEKKGLQAADGANLPLDSGHPRLPGERNREGSESSDRELELDTSSLELCDGTGAFDNRSYCGSARFAPPSVGGGLQSPRGPPPPPNLGQAS